MSVLLVNITVPTMLRVLTQWAVLPVRVIEDIQGTDRKGTEFYIYLSNTVCFQMLVTFFR